MRLASVSGFLVLLACGAVPEQAAKEPSTALRAARLTFSDTYVPVDPALMATRCAHWDPELARAEDALVDLINRRRIAGADCGSRGAFSPTRSLVLDARLRCAARVHAFDMDRREFFGHKNPDGDDYAERAKRAGFRATYIGENNAAHLRNPAVVLQGFLASDRHCANLMDRRYHSIGVGLHQGQSSYWSVLFGRP